MFPSMSPGITVLTGPMFAGKTTRLHQNIHTYRFLGKSVIIVKHLSDIRSMTSKVRQPPFPPTPSFL